jgi:hypothetical protein
MHVLVAISIAAFLAMLWAVIAMVRHVRIAREKNLPHREIHPPPPPPSPKP